MFTVDLAEYVRLSYASLEDACQAHADAALRLARWSTVFRVATLVATGVSAGLALASATWRPSWYIAAAVAAVSAFAASAAYAGFNQHSRIHGHRACSARLWLVCEQYRELLVEMDGGLIELPALRARRHALLQEASAVFEHVAPVDRYTFAIARRALGARSGAPVSVPAC